MYYVRSLYKYSYQTAKLTLLTSLLDVRNSYKLIKNKYLIDNYLFINIVKYCK